MQHDKEERLTLTVEAAARRLGISRSLAWEQVRTGHIPSLRLGRRVLIPIRGLERLLEQAVTPEVSEG